MQRSSPPNRTPFVVPKSPETAQPQPRFSRFLARWNPWVITVVFTVLVFIFNVGLDWAIVREHEPPFRTVEFSDVISAILAGILFYYVARFTRERRRRVLQRLNTIAEMNHHIRNALEVISLSAHTSRDQQHVQAIRESVQRINWALTEILPKL